MMMALIIMMMAMVVMVMKVLIVMGIIKNTQKPVVWVIDITWFVIPVIKVIIMMSPVPIIISVATVSSVIPTQFPPVATLS